MNPRRLWVQVVNVAVKKKAMIEAKNAQLELATIISRQLDLRPNFGRVAIVLPSVSPLLAQVAFGRTDCLECWFDTNCPKCHGRGWL